MFHYEWIHQLLVVNSSNSHLVLLWLHPMLIYSYYQKELISIFVISYLIIMDTASPLISSIALITCPFLVIVL